MGPGEIGAMIPIFGIMCGMLAIWTHHQRKMARIQAQETAEKAAQYVASNTELEQRVRVLERIVTDKGYDVSSQIEALRDARKVEALLDSREEELRK